MRPNNENAEMIDGKGTAATIRKEIAAEVADLKEKTGKVGPSSASQSTCMHRHVAGWPTMTRMSLPVVASRCRAWL